MNLNQENKFRCRLEIYETYIRDYINNIVIYC